VVGFKPYLPHNATFNPLMNSGAYFVLRPQLQTLKRWVWSPRKLISPIRRAGSGPFAGLIEDRKQQLGRNISILSAIKP